MQEEVKPIPLLFDTFEHRLELTRNTHVAWHNDSRVELLRDGTHLGLGLLIEVGDCKLSACLPERLRTTCRNALVIGDTNYEAALSGKIDDGRNERSLSAKNE